MPSWAPWRGRGSMPSSCVPLQTVTLHLETRTRALVLLLSFTIVLSQLSDARQRESPLTLVVLSLLSLYLFLFLAVDPCGPCDRVPQMDHKLNPETLSTLSTKPSTFVVHMIGYRRWISSRSIKRQDMSRMRCASTPSSAPLRGVCPHRWTHPTPNPPPSQNFHERIACAVTGTMLNRKQRQGWEVEEGDGDDLRDEEQVGNRS